MEPEPYYRALTKECLLCEEPEYVFPIIAITITLIAVIAAVLYYVKDSIKRLVDRYDEAILVAKNNGTMVMVTMQIIVSLNNIHSFQGGGEYSGPYGEFISVAQILVLDVFELFHFGCSVKGDYANKLYLSTLVGYRVCSLN